MPHHRLYLDIDEKLTAVFIICSGNVKLCCWTSTRLNVLSWCCEISFVTQTWNQIKERIAGACCA